MSERLTNELSSPFSTRDLSRSQLERLLMAYREEYLASFAEYLDADPQLGGQALIDFEKEILDGE